MSCTGAYTRLLLLFTVQAAAFLPNAASAQTANPPAPLLADSLSGTNPPAAAPAPAAKPASPPGAPVASTASSPSSAAAAPAATPSDSGVSETAEWVKRDTDIGEQNSLTGGAGLLRTEHAQSNAPGQFRLSFVGEWFSAGFLCTSKFPCPNPNGGNPITNDDMSHVGGTLTLGVAIAQLGPGILDGSAGIVTYANSDNANRPALLQVLGDSIYGIRYLAPIGDVFHVGFTTNLLLVNGSGSVGLNSAATSARFMALGTADLRGLSSPVPLRISGNIAYSLDNTAAVVEDTEAARQQPITRIERYGLGISRVDHVDFLLGAEGLFADGLVRPFIESRVEVPNNRQGYVCNPNNVGFDNCLKNDAVVPAVLTLGGRFYPWKREFSVLAAIDIGLSGMNNFIEEVQPVPPWTLYLGLGWTAETWERPVQRIVEKVAAPPSAPRTVHVIGFVHEKDKNEPVVGAILAYRDRADLPRIATGPDGRFGDDVLPGAYSYEIRADGFKPAICDFTTQAPSTPPANALGGQQSAAEAVLGPPKTPASPPGATGVKTVAAAPSVPANIELDCPMEALPRLGVVVGHLRDADTNQPLSGTSVTLTDAQRKESRAMADPTGSVRFESVAPGTATLSVLAEGYLALITPQEVKARQESTVELVLQKKPARPEVQVTNKEITIRDQIQFALDSAIILPQSFGILTEVADTLIRHPEIKRVEVQGHTDNSGTPEHNATLSEDRAAAVKDWLTSHGVPGERLVAKGYGQTRPLAPNVTAANRSQNRRVQFIILEKEGGAPPPKSTLPGF